MRPLRRSPRRADVASPQDVAVVLQAASVLLDHPDDDASVELVAAAVAELPAPLPSRAHLEAFLGWWLPQRVVQRQQVYVDTFDHRRRCALHLTYFREGDTRRRGDALAQLRDALGRLGAEVDSAELPDYLPLLLEVGAAVPEARVLLRNEVRSLEALRCSLADLGSPFGDVVVAVLHVLPPLTPDDVAAVDALIRSGPRQEEVGMDTVPVPAPRRARS